MPTVPNQALVTRLITLIERRTAKFVQDKGRAPRGSEITGIERKVFTAEAIRQPQRAQAYRDAIRAQRAQTVVATPTQATLWST